MAPFTATCAARTKPVPVLQRPKLIPGHASSKAQQQTKLVTRLSGSAEGTERAVDHQQSFEVVQTLLLISLASICYLRNLLPESGFEDRDWSYVPEDTHWGYEDFRKGVFPPGNTLPEGPHRNRKKVKILAQSGSVGAKKLMSWLDGIFDALRRGVLDSMQLSVILDKDKPSNVLESYTFKFQYTERQLDGMMVSSSPRGTPVTLRDVRSSLASLNRFLMELTEGLPDLPPTRFLTVHVFYTEDCPQEYVAPGFRPSREHNIFVPHNDLWRMTVADAGSTDLGFYHVGLKVAYLAPITDAGIELDSEEQIPSDIEFNQSIFRIQDSSQGVVDHAGAKLLVDRSEKTKASGYPLQQHVQQMMRTRSGKRGLAATQLVQRRNEIDQSHGLMDRSRHLTLGSTQLSGTQSLLNTQPEEQGDFAAEYASTTDGSTDELLQVGPEKATPGKTRKGIQPPSNSSVLTARLSKAPMPPPKSRKASASKKRAIEAGEENRQTQRKSARVSARSPHNGTQ